MQLQDELIEDWARQAELRSSIVRWRWFDTAFRDALAQACARQDVLAHVHDALLCRAFFDWAQDVESHQLLETVDPVDFRHAMAGLLLQHLLAAQLHGPGPDRLLALHDHADSAEHRNLPATLITGIVLSLLQALRLHAGAPKATLDAELELYWASFLENAAQQPAMAICYLDRMTGLEPMWSTPTLIGQRPALRAAMALPAA